MCWCWGRQPHAVPLTHCCGDRAVPDLCLSHPSRLPLDCHRANSRDRGSPERGLWPKALPGLLSRLLSTSSSAETCRTIFLNCSPARCQPQVHTVTPVAKHIFRLTHSLQLSSCSISSPCLINPSTLWQHDPAPRALPASTAKPKSSASDPDTAPSKPAWVPPAREQPLHILSLAISLVINKVSGLRNKE